ncbi:MAG TPA: sulfotransferase [Rhizomicrobium sp.]|jgi:hypothetical protein
MAEIDQRWLAAGQHGMCCGRVEPVGRSFQGMVFEEKTFVLGVGAQKAGTTWLHDYLSQRGDIHMPRKEIHYFNKKYGPGREPDEFDNSAFGQKRGGDFYREFFRKRVPDEINFFGEITPAYAIIGKRGFQEIKNLFSKSRVIFIMRDPVQRFYSQIRMFRDKWKDVDHSDLDSFLDKRKFVERSQYEKTIRALESAFSREEIIYLFYETLFCSESIEFLCHAIGVPYIPADLENVVNSGGARDQVAPSIHDRLLEKFEPTYRFCNEKFGSALPAQWHSPDQPVRERPADADQKIATGETPDSMEQSGTRNGAQPGCGDTRAIQPARN